VRGRAFSLARNSHLGVLALCDDVAIAVEPLVHGSGLWRTVRRPSASRLLWIARYAALALVGAAFAFLFRSGRHASVLRSVLVVQACCFFMLDPLRALVELCHALSFIDSLMFALFWWRGASEVFLQYGPRARQPPAFYRSAVAVPAGAALLALLAAAAVVIAVLAAVFLAKVGETQGKATLTVHIVAGAGTMFLLFVVKVCRVLEAPLRDEFICQTIEITALGCYAFFQMIFQMGERNDEAEECIAKPKKYEKIEEMLEALTHLDDEVQFDLRDCEK
jgi:hypothetical protein